MWNKFKQFLLLTMANWCFKQLQAKFQEEHDLHMQEIIDYINERHEAGVEINLIAHPDMVRDKFALHSEPVPHLKVIKLEEE